MRKTSRGEVWLISMAAALPILAVLATLVVGQLVQRRSLHGPQDPLPPPNDTWEVVALNIGTMSNLFWGFVNFEHRYPADEVEFQTYKNGLYMRVLMSDMVNPYTGQPPEWVLTPSPGNFTWINNPDGSVIVRLYYLEDGPEIKTWDLNATLEDLAQQRANDSSDWGLTGTDEDKHHQNFISWRFDGLATLTRMQGMGVWPPRTYEQLVQWDPHLAKYRNPHSGGFVLNVPADSPSEGNFTFTVLYDAGGHVEKYRMDWYMRDPSTGLMQIERTDYLWAWVPGEGGGDGPMSVPPPPPGS